MDRMKTPQDWIDVLRDHLKDESIWRIEKLKEWIKDIQEESYNEGKAEGYEAGRESPI
jgi:flagellar biosynthesis/type III secretory pathway protein FliH